MLLKSIVIPACPESFFNREQFASNQFFFTSVIPLKRGINDS